MGRLTTSTRDELVAAAGRRYIEVDRHERGRILDELTSLTGLGSMPRGCCEAGERASGTMPDRSVASTTRPYARP
jgi:hypothetical protein